MTSRFAFNTIRTLFTVLTCTRLIVFCSDVSVAAAAPLNSANPVVHQDVLSDQDLLNLTNANRLAHGEAPLKLNDQLNAAAEAKAEDMVEKGYWDHFRPGDHKAPWDFIQESGYQYQVAGENLARGFKTAGGITRAWMASPTHAANILSPKYTDIGFATTYTYDSNGERVLLTVQMFGSR